MTSRPPIRFAQVQRAVFWKEFVLENFALQDEELQKLLNFGALYLNHKRWSPGASQILAPGDLVRLHPSPKRFPFERLTENSLRAVESDWVLLWKPAGVPSHETLDNVLENAKVWAESRLGEKLWSLNRLDVGTRGWLLLARNAAFAGFFNREMIAGRVRKFYETLSPAPRQGAGLWKHRMLKSQRAPKVIVADSAEASSEDSLACKLRVEWMRFGPRDQVGSRLELLTGRTHQIRAQFAFEGAPLFGDALYGGAALGNRGFEEFALSCEELRFNDLTGPRCFSRPADIPALSEFYSTLVRDPDQPKAPGTL